MTTYGAYDAGLPCKNPSCASHGKPHPNCKCYGGYADGGKVEFYCSKNRPHKADCQYFADGGKVKPEKATETVAKIFQEMPVDQEKDLAHAISNAGAHGLFKGISDHETYAKHARQGASKMERQVKALFAGEQMAHEVDEKLRDKIKKYLEEGGLDQNIQAQLHGTDSSNKMEQPLAEATPLTQSHPAINMQLQTARGRIANYLNSLRPTKMGPKLAFDDHMDDPEKDRIFDRAVDLSINPLSVLTHVARGTIEPEHMKHMNGMFPEVNEQLQKRITEEIVKSQLNEKKPNFRVRQGLSLMMGTPLSGEMTPQAIMAAQATFASAQPPQQPQAKATGKSSKASLTKSDQAFLTGDQALEKRRQKV